MGSEARKTHGEVARKEIKTVTEAGIETEAGRRRSESMGSTPEATRAKEVEVEVEVLDADIGVESRSPLLLRKLKSQPPFSTIERVTSTTWHTSHFTHMIFQSIVESGLDAVLDSTRIS